MKQLHTPARDEWCFCSGRRPGGPGFTSENGSRRDGGHYSLRQSARLLLIVIFSLVGCAPSQPGNLWTLNNLKQIGGHTPEVIGSPQVVDSSIRFNGESDGLLLPVNPIEGLAEFTIEMLIKPDAGGPLEQRFLHFQDSSNSRGLLELRMYDNGWALDAFLFSTAGQLALFDRTKLHPPDRWTWVAMTYRAGTIQSFVDGVKELEGPLNFPVMGAGQTSIGVRQNRVSWFKGQIRQVRFHPTALAAEALQKSATR